MMWQEAVRCSAQGSAERIVAREGEQARIVRNADGDARYIFRGYVRAARPQEIEGFADWQPTVPRENS